MIGGIGFPLLLCILNIILQVKMEHQLKYENHVKVVKLLMTWLIPVLSIVTVPSMLAISMGIQVNISRLLKSFFALLFIIIGNYLPKTRKNNIFGVRVPWTLRDEVVWKKTHHMTGYLWVVGGFAMLIGVWIGGLNEIYEFTILWILIVVPIVYSYILSKRLKKNVACHILFFRK